ncbi:MAG: tRNA guanosine(34) transglycosylase Tgt [Spirochaetes bacterium]|jgi:queuine tRNA-ribosyltransferase|nr:tRNA guanosine(34) transglycosylase Tgt [Spirochaetota bacterium]
MFTLLSRESSSQARRGRLSLWHGTVETPVFMPVATRGAIRALPQSALAEIGFEIILSNTYHLYIRPGMDVLKEAGGLHSFMNCQLPVLTDSGGFQVFSLSSLCKVMEHGVQFSSHLDGSKHLFTPQSVLDIQRTIGSDIMMILDQCVEYPADHAYAKAASDRTIRWADEAISYYREAFDHERQKIFAIVQGSTHADLRRDCARRLVDLDFPGYAIGGLSVGEPKDLYAEISELTAAELPEDKPRYMMGVGSPLEIMESVAHGVDMFDCVMPTRIARNGTLYTSQGRVNIRNRAYEKDFTPLDPDCGCYVCRNFTKSYLRHIFRVGEISALIYNTHHNLSYMKKLMLRIRESIENDTFNELRSEIQRTYGR